MEMKNCKKCGKVFASMGDRVCPECKQIEDEQFKNVKEYLYDHPSATIPEICEDLEIEEDVILRFLREGRIEIADKTVLLLKCEKCGKPIHAGKYCAVCQQKLLNTFSAANESNMRRIDDGPKMHSEGIRNN